MVQWSALHLGVYLSDVGTYDSQGDQDEATDKPYREHQGSPTLNDMTGDQ